MRWELDGRRACWRQSQNQADASLAYTCRAADCSGVSVQAPSLQHTWPHTTQVCLPHAEADAGAALCAVLLLAAACQVDLQSAQARLQEMQQQQKQREQDLQQLTAARPKLLQRGCGGDAAAANPSHKRAKTAVGKAKAADKQQQQQEGDCDADGDEQMQDAAADVEMDLEPVRDTRQDRQPGGSRLGRPPIAASASAVAAGGRSSNNRSRKLMGNTSNLRSTRARVVLDSSSSESSSASDADDECSTSSSSSDGSSSSEDEDAGNRRAQRQHAVTRSGRGKLQAAAGRVKQQQQRAKGSAARDEDTKVPSAVALAKQTARLRLRQQQLEDQEQELQQEVEGIDRSALEEDLAALQGLSAAHSRLQQLQEQHEAAAAALEKMLDERYSCLLSVLQSLNVQLDKVYNQLTGGCGKAYCSYTAERGLLFSQGVTLHVQPDGSTWRRLGMLSGGQKALATLALSFALQVKLGLV